MRTASNPLLRPLGLLGVASVMLLPAACGSAHPPTSGASAASASASPSTTAPDPGLVKKFRAPEDLSAAVVAAIRAKGSVLITTTGKGAAIVGHREVQLVKGSENYSFRVTVPGQADQSLVVIGDVPYVAISDDPVGRHWMQLSFAELAANKTWASAAYAVDLPAEFDAWKLARGMSGGEAGTTAGEAVRTYTLTMGPEAAAAQIRLDRVPAADRASVAERLAQLSFDLTVTVGADDLPRSITSLAPASGLTTTQDYSQWGQVMVTPPAPADIRTVAAP